MYVCMYVSMYISIYVCMEYICIYVWVGGCTASLATEMIERFYLCRIFKKLSVMSDAP
jgi:hypothetical protein